MCWVWCVVSACLAREIDCQSTYSKLSPCFLLNENLVHKSLKPCDFDDQKRVNGDCKVPMSHDGKLWHQVKEGLWFKATGTLEFEEDKYTALSNRLECDPANLNCALSSVISVSASETWGYSNSTSVKLGAKLLEILMLEASVTEGSSHSYTSSKTTSSETSYTCSISGNHTVYLAARLQYYLVFGYVSEWIIVNREFYIDDNGNMREQDYWGWDVSCQPMFRIPKVQFDHSVAGPRRCVVKARDCTEKKVIMLS